MLSRHSFSRLSRLPFAGGKGAKRTAVLAGTALAVVAAPLALAAEGGTIRGGARNPSSNPSQSYSKETQIIADNSSYGTRQSNKGTGGGAIYGCRSGATGAACIAAVNLKAGHAFSFTSSGNVGGTITLANTLGAPLTTNATGVATGFNANYLQGHQASEFLGVKAEAANSAELGGQPATSYATTGQLLFADVAANGTLGATRGATAAATSGTTGYTVTFGTTNLSKCSLTASPTGGALKEGSIGLEVTGSGSNLVAVSAPSALEKGFDLQVTC